MQVVCNFNAMKNQKHKLSASSSNIIDNMFQAYLPHFEQNAAWSYTQQQQHTAVPPQQQHMQQQTAAYATAHMISEQHQQQQHNLFHNQQQHHHQQQHQQPQQQQQPQSLTHNSNLLLSNESPQYAASEATTSAGIINSFNAYNAFAGSRQPTAVALSLSQHNAPQTVTSNSNISNFFDNWPAASVENTNVAASSTATSHHQQQQHNRNNLGSSCCFIGGSNSSSSSTSVATSNYDKRNLSRPLLSQYSGEFLSSSADVAAASNYFPINNAAIGNSRKRKFAAMPYDMQQSNNNSNIDLTESNIYNSNLNMLHSSRNASISNISADNMASTSNATTTSTSNIESMDKAEIANFLATELFKNKLISVNGIQSGVPTQTTPTLTPTTMRYIQEAFNELTQDISAPYQAGFKPPPLASSSLQSTNTILAATSAPTSVAHFNDSIKNEYNNDGNDSDSDNSQASYEQQGNDDISSATSDTSSVAAADSSSFQSGLNGISNNISSINDFSAANVAILAAASGQSSFHQNTTSSAANSSPATKTTKRNQGGRRPTKTVNMSPEEEEKRRVRRERNKLAAARCRKRRVDQTNELLDEVAQLEGKRDNLQKDIEQLTSTKQQLQRLLDKHRPTCQKIRNDLLSVSTFGGLIVPTNEATDGISRNITGLDSSLASTAGRSTSPVDLKPVLHDRMMEIVQIKNEPLESAFDSSSSLDHEGPSSPKRALLGSNNPMIPPPLPAAATLSPQLAAAAHVSLNTPIVTSAPVDFSSFDSANATLNTINTLNGLQRGIKPRPNSLPTIPRNMAQNLSLSVDNRQQPLDINGVAIQTPSTGMFNFDSLMDGGTGLTPVSGPLVPTCSSHNKHPLELTTPTSEPSKLVSL